MQAVPENYEAWGGIDLRTRRHSHGPKVVLEGLAGFVQIGSGLHPSIR
jgi:hypothetical protein